MWPRTSRHVQTCASAVSYARATRSAWLLEVAERPVSRSAGPIHPGALLPPTMAVRRRSRANTSASLPRPLVVVVPPLALVGIRLSQRLGRDSVTPWAVPLEEPRTRLQHP